MDLLFAFADPGDTRAGRFEVVGPDAHGDFQTKQTIPLPQDPELRAAGVGEIVKKGDLEILVSDREGQLRRLSRTGEELARWDAGARFSARPVVADLTGQGENLILIEKAHGTVVALDARHLLAVGNGRRAAPITSSVGENGTPVPDYQQPQVVWEHRGWGFEFGLAAADFRGDGTQLAAFAAEAAQQGLSGVVAVDARGDIIWQTPLPPIVPHLNLKTVRGWMPGRFAPDRQQGADLYVCAWDTPPVGAGNWDHSFALDGRTGKILWRNDGQDPAIALHSLGPGVLPALYDVNGDGLDDILMISQEIYVILNGADGNFLRPPIGAGFVGAKSWTAYGSIGLAWLTGQEKPDVIYRPGSGVEAVFNLQDEKPLWTFDPTSGGFAVVADFDGCGKPELAGNRGGVLTFLDPVSGQGKYQLTEPRYAPQEMCVCDINGDGKPEIVAASGSVVFAAQVADGQVRVVWTCDLGAPLGAPLVADVNGDGQCEVLVCTNDGQLCAVGP
jgi:outer membrane protein assembly factor BamB